MTGAARQGWDTHLELPYHRAVQLGPFLVESEGLAEVLQALEGRHGLQLTVVYLWEGVWDPAGEGSWPGLEGTIPRIKGVEGPPRSRPRASALGSAELLLVGSPGS